MKLKQSDYLLIIIVVLAGIWGFGMMSVIVDDTERLSPEAYTFLGTVTNYDLMDSSSGYGSFISNSYGEVFFRNVNDPFTKVAEQEGYITFKIQYADVTANDEGARITLKVFKDSDSSTPAAIYHLFGEDFDGGVHWITKTTTHKLSMFDTNNDGVINKATILHRDDYKDGLRIYELQYIITFEEQEPDPCEGVVCNDKCVGTTLYYDGYCDDGTCKWTTEYDSDECGYEEPDPCDGVTCPDKCIGVYRATGGYCEDSICIYTSEEKIDGMCGYEEGYTPTPTPTNGNGDDDDGDTEDDILIIGGLMVGIIAVLALLYFAIKAKR